MFINQISSANVKYKNNQPSFKANLYNYDGEKITCFEYGKNISEYGGKNTDIFVKDFISTKEIPEAQAYDNYIECIISNPLFENVAITYNSRHQTNTPVKGEYASELWHLDLMTGSRTDYCKDLENKALEQSLIGTIKAIIANNDYKSNLNPIHLFEERLKQIPASKHGFDESRIAEFKEVAQKLLNKLVKKAVK